MQLTCLTVRDYSWGRYVRPGQRIFVLHSTNKDRHIPKAAAFRWNPGRKKWWTDDADKAAKLVEWADWSCREELHAVLRRNNKLINMSRASNSDIEIPAPEGCEYLGYQKAGIHYGMQKSNVLIADEMGLGKTIQAIGIINSDESIKTALVICPASVKHNWYREMRKWLVRRFAIGIADGKICPSPEDGFAITIINYDVVQRYPVLKRVQWDIVIADESHNIKNLKTIRGSTIVGDEKAPGIYGRRIVALTGTPILNRPGEIWATLYWLDRDTWSGKEWYFLRRFCGGKWNGCCKERMPELQEKLRTTIMIRRKKADVLKDLPPKFRHVITLEVSDDETKDLIRKEKELSGKKDYFHLQAEIELAKTNDNEDAYRAAVDNLKASIGDDIGELARIRKEVSLAKIPYAIEHLNSLVDSVGKVVVFAYHNDVILALHAALPGSVVLYGQTKIEDRQKAVDRFQNDPDCSVFIGSIGAAGVGITLTAASNVVFVELDWVPGKISQAEDRCHRLGQKDTVVVQHIVLDDSLDARMAQTVVKKQKIIDAALDDSVDPEVPEVPVDDSERPATQTLRRDQIAKQAEKIQPIECFAVLEGLRLLSEMCDGARREDGAGFSKIDAEIGHSLAQSYRLSPKQAVLGRKICRKYRRQLPESLIERMGA